MKIAAKMINNGKNVFPASPRALTHRGRGRLSARLQVAFVVLLVRETQAAALAKAGRLPGMSAHVGHQQ